MTRRLLRSLGEQLVIEQRLDQLLADRRPLRTLGPEQGRRVLMYLRVAALRAPDLIDRTSYPALTALAAVEPLRPAWTWTGGDVRAFLEHLFVGVRYPLPAFLFPLIRDGSEPAARALRILGQGGSVRDLADLPPGFTRRMGHVLWLVDAAESWAEAVCLAIVRSLGGPDAVAVEVARCLLRWSSASDRWIVPVLSWLVRNPVPDDELAVVARHLRRCHTRGIRFDRWRARRARREALEAIAGPIPSRCELFPAPPWVGGAFSSGGEQWRMDRLRTPFELYLEGRVLQHCSATYASKVRAGHSALFSLKNRSGRCITVEVSAGGRIIQAKGKRNRLPEPAENRAIAWWGLREGLHLGVVGHGLTPGEPDPPAGV